MFTAVLENEVELGTRWVNVRAAIRAGMRRGVALGVKEGAEEARARHVFKNQTGELEKSIKGQVTGNSPTSHTGEIVATKAYASFVENGTRPHEIRPKNGKLLHWEAPQGDHHFARVVHHPGTKPHPFMSFAFFKCERVMIREIEIGAANAQAILDR